MNEKISRFLDNDLSHDETLNLLQTIEARPELKDKLKRYAAVSHALKTDDFLWISADFSTRIQQEIQQVPIDDSLESSKKRLN
jgi:sigma-E factor negative regulatory protein RseA